ncbi:MAG: hypothetical protein R3B90_00170 [Planctomycetaceae bacterium]
MADRRSLIEGLKSTPPAMDIHREKEFVYGSKDKPAEPAKTPAPASAATVSRVPISTRIRADFSTALKRASLERQLNGTQPNTLQDILEEAIEPWLRNNGYLS